MFGQRKSRIDTKGRGKISKESLQEYAPRLLRLALPHRNTLFWGFLALMLGSGINLLFPYLVRAVLNENYGFELERDLGLCIIGLITLFGVQAFFFYLRHYCFAAVGYRIVAKLRQSLFDSILAQDISFFDRTRIGDTLSRLSSDTELVQKALTINISVALRYLIQVIGGTILMLVISVRLTMVILVLLPLFVFSSMIWGKKLRNLSRKMQNELGNSTVVAEEAVGAIRTVRVFAGERYETNRYAKAIGSVLGIGEQRAQVAAQFSSAMVFVMNSAIERSCGIGSNGLPI